MTSIKLYGKLATKFLDDNAPAVLSGIAILGSASIGYLTWRSTNQAVERLTEEYKTRSMMTPGDKPVLQLSQTEKLKVTWSCYIPPFVATAATIGAIVCSHHISAKRAAALAAAYSMSERAYSEYRDKVVEKFKPTQEQKVRDEIAQDRVTNNPPDGQVMMLAGSEVLCYDKPNDRYFKSTMEDIRAAQNDINKEVNRAGCATLEAFYSYIGIPATVFSHELGFTDEVPLDVKFSTTFSTEKTPCMVVDYNCVPLRGNSAFESM
jgi:hypothetical protein